jgi:hypothetical protein
VEIVPHVSDDTLKRYGMQTLPDWEPGPLLEEHLLICPERRERLDAESEFVTAMRGAAVKSRKHAD